MTTQKRAVIYCRVSRDDQSCDRQERDLRQFALSAGFKVVGIYKEKISGAKDDRPERKKVLALAQGRKIDVVLCTELTRWGRSTLDLISTLRELHQRGVSLVAQTGLQCDLDTPQGKLFVTILAGLAEFERDLVAERTRSGLAAAKARGKRLGRVPGQQIARVKAVEADVLAQVASGTSYRKVASNLGIHKDTVGKIVKRSRITIVL